MRKPFKSPDLSAPRYKLRRLNNLDIKFYKRFIKKFPKYKDVPIDQIKNIIIEYNTSIWEHVVMNRDGAELPEGLGYLFIGSCPAMVKKNNLDKVLSIKYQQYIKHRNFESDSFIAKIFYTNYANRYKFSMRELWMFKGCRAFTRATSKEYVKSWMNYVKVDSFLHVRKLFTKLITRDIAIMITPRLPENYNEFEFN